MAILYGDWEDHTMKPGVKPASYVTSDVYGNFYGSSHTSATTGAALSLVVSLLASSREAVRTGDSSTFERASAAANAIMECFPETFKDVDLAELVANEVANREQVRAYREQILQMAGGKEYVESVESFERSTAVKRPDLTIRFSSPPSYELISGTTRPVDTDTPGSGNTSWAASLWKALF